MLVFYWRYGRDICSVEVRVLNEFKINLGYGL